MHLVHFSTEIFSQNYLIQKLLCFSMSQHDENIFKNFQIPVG